MPYPNTLSSNICVLNSVENPYVSNTDEIPIYGAKILLDKYFYEE